MSLYHLLVGHGTVAIKVRGDIRVTMEEVSESFNSYTRSEFPSPSHWFPLSY